MMELEPLTSLLTLLALLQLVLLLEEAHNHSQDQLHVTYLILTFNLDLGSWEKISLSVMRVGSSSTLVCAVIDAQT